MLIKIVVAFKRRVKIIRETASETAIIIGRRLSLVLPLTDPPIIIGSNGRTHGAKTVSMPAIKAPMSKNISNLPSFFLIILLSLPALQLLPPAAISTEPAA
jgi:hypothetical protein